MRMRQALCFGIIVAAVLTLGSVQTAGAQQTVKLGSGDTLTIGGFINATLYNNRGLFDGFGQGQNAEWAALAQPTTDMGFLDGDVRNTRLRLDFASGPVLGKWAPKATLEADFFGPIGAPPFGDEQPTLRGRFAYVDLTDGRTTLRVGQFWAPLFGEVPVSVTHLAFPLGYGATGMIGWRFPGIFLYHDLTTKGMTAQLQVALLKGSGPAVGASGVGSGEASGKPQFEVRLNAAKKLGGANWNGYVVYHVDNKDINGVGVTGGNQNAWGIETGHNVTSGKFTVHGNFYFGHNLGQQFAHINQGSGSSTAALQGKIQGWGAWGQAGYDFTPRWSFWFYYGMDQPNAAKYLADNGAALLRQMNHDTDALIRFRAGRYALGLEYFRAVTRWSTVVQSADQYAVSVLYTL